MSFANRIAVLNSYDVLVESEPVDSSSQHAVGDHGRFRYAVRYAAEKAGGMSRVVAAAARAVAREARTAGNEELAAEKQKVAVAATARAAQEAAPARLQQLVRAFQCASGTACVP